MDKQGKMDWMNEQPEATEAPSDLGLLCKKAAELREEITFKEAGLKHTQEVFNRVRDEILRTLELMNIDSTRAHGFLFYRENKTSVTTPKTVEDKQKLFAWLEEQGMFLEMVSINSQTLNSLYKSLAEDAAARGILEFKLPGVGEPTTYANLKIRKG